MGSLGKTLALLLTTFALISSIIVLSTAVKASASSDDWTMVNHDAGHNRYSSEELPLKLFEKWNLTISIEYISEVSVANGVGYVYTFGNPSDSKLIAFNATTGKLIWSSHDSWLPTSSAGSPAFYNGLVYTGSAAFSASSGEWMFNYTYSKGLLQVTAPTVSDNVVFLGYIADFSSYSGGVMALNASSGKVMWDVTAYSFPTSSPTVADGIVYFSTGNVIALNALSGKLLWHSSIQTDYFSPIAVADGRVFIGGDKGILYCLNALTGQELWNYPANIKSEVCPAVAKGVVYASNYANTFALNESTGAVIWNNSLLSGSSPVIVNDRVYVSLYNLASGGLEPYEYDIYGLEASSGNVIWNYSLPVHYYAYFSDSPVVANGMLYVAPTAGQVYAFGEQSTSPSDGSQLENSIGSNFLLIGIIIILILAVVVLLLLFRRHRKTTPQNKMKT